MKTLSIIIILILGVVIWFTLNTPIIRWTENSNGPAELPIIVSVLRTDQGRKYKFNSSEESEVKLKARLIRIKSVFEEQPVLVDVDPSSTPYDVFHTVRLIQNVGLPWSLRLSSSYEPATEEEYLKENANQAIQSTPLQRRD